MKPGAPPKAQRGIALWTLLTIVAMAGAYAFYKNTNKLFNRNEQDIKQTLMLAQAKEALIAYAVLDDQRPGRLLCPALDSSGTSPLLSRDDCDKYIGILPWKTLDIRDYQDDHGSVLHLAIYRLFGGDRMVPPINSYTPTAMRLTAADGSINDDVAAVIIAPRGTLDPPNNDGDDNFQAGRSTAEGDNDLIVVITRQELMAATEKRIANEVRSCLERHAASSANSDHRYPWPAPLSATAYQGKANSLFGRVPTTQPTAGPEAALKLTIAKLTQNLNQLTLAPDAGQQMNALNTLSDSLLQARNFFGAIFLAANRLKQVADDATNRLTEVEQAVNDAVNDNGRISRSEGTTIRSLASTPDSLLDALAEQLAQNGIDIFPWQLGQYVQALNRSSTSSEFANQTLSIRNFLLVATTPRADISPALSAAQVAATLACDPTAPLAERCDGELARNNAGNLISALSALQASVESSRVNVLASDVSPYTSTLNSLNTTLHNAPSVENLNALLLVLTSTRTAISNINTGVSAVVSNRNNALSAFDSAIGIAQASRPDYATIEAATATAIATITQLATAISTNEQVDNNVSRTSLLASIASYKAALSSFTLQDTASPRPVQSTITPFAKALGNATVNLEIWTKTLSTNAALVASLAKANTVPSGVDPLSATILESSAYKIAGDALTSITGKNESAALLQAYIDAPTAANQASSITALGETISLVTALLGAANALDGQLASTSANAFPLVWMSSRCDFLLPTSTSWWAKNQWADTLFYQLGNVAMGAPGKLTVNGTGSYRLVTLASGRPLIGQNRPNLTTADFLEGINAHLSRNGDAASPNPDFTAMTPSANFNDRLSF